MRTTSAVTLAVLCLMGLAATGQPALAATGFEAVIRADNPTSWWRFEDPSTANGATAYDAIGTAHGTYTGGTTQVTGISGKAVFFNPTDGGDYVTAPNVPMTRDFTVELWARSATPTWNEYGWLSAERGPNGYIVHPDPGGRSWRGFAINNAGVYAQIGSHTPAAIDDRLHHYVITFDSATTTGKMYFDGVPVAVNASFNPPRDAASSITVEIGRDDIVGRNGYGSIDEVSIYNRAIGDVAVKRHFISGSAGPYSELLQAHGATIHYRLEDGPIGSAPTTVVDSALMDDVGLGDDGTYYNGVTMKSWRAGVGASFDGVNDYLQASILVPQSFTVELWGKSDTATWNDYGWLASARAANGFIIHPSLGSRTWDGYVFNDAGSFVYIGSYTPADITDFHHYALTYDHTLGIAKMYFDGQMVAQRVGVIPRLASPSPLTLTLGSDGGGGRYGKGMIDEFAFFPMALSADQIFLHYQFLVPEPGAGVLLALGAFGLVLLAPALGGKNARRIGPG